MKAICVSEFGGPEVLKLEDMPNPRPSQSGGVLVSVNAAGVTEESYALRHHTRMIANQDGSVYSTRCSAAYAVYREDQWQRRSKHTELES